MVSQSVSTTSKRKSLSDRVPLASNKRNKVATTQKPTQKSGGKPNNLDRQSHRKHANIVQDGKRIWNLLRLKDNKPAQNRALMDELMPLIRGRAREIALQHDASRVVQAAIQFGNGEERREILKELCATLNGKQKVASAGKSSQTGLVELCKSQYASFVVLKVIKYACNKDEECVSILTASLKGNMAKLAIHATASRVVEALFQALSPKKMHLLKQEFYGPHFSLFASDTTRELSNSNKLPTLASNLKIYPEKKAMTLDFVRHLVNKGIEKQLYGFVFFQDLLLEYLELVQPIEIRAVAATTADHTIHLLSTRNGAKAVALMASYGTAKDRKRMVKGLKGYGRSGLLHHDAYLAILRLVQVTDDTVSIHRNLFNELLSHGPSQSSGDNANTTDESKTSPLLEIALSDSGSKLFLLVLVDQERDQVTWQKSFDPYEHSILFPAPTIAENGQDAVPTSKKDASLRRTELLRQLHEPLIHLCCQHTDKLMRSIPGGAILKQVYASFHPLKLVEAILDVCDVSPGEIANKAENERPFILEDSVGHRTVKNLILLDSVDPKEQKNSAESFAFRFFERFEHQMIIVANSNRGAFVVAALCRVPGIRIKILKVLEVKRIQSLCKKEGPTAGFVALLKEIKNDSEIIM